MQTTLVIDRTGLQEDRREKLFEDVQGGDLLWTTEQCQAEVIWFEDAGKKRRIKDRENALDGLVLNSPTNVIGMAAPACTHKINQTASSALRQVE